MLTIPLYNFSGERTGEVEIDPGALGSRVRPALLKQAIVAYEANQRLGSSATKSRSMVEGSTRKLYRQKGTGNARMGPIRTNVRRGGGVAFAKGAQNFTQAMPKKMRRLARDNAVLAKILSEDAVVVDDLAMSEPKTRRLAEFLGKVGAGAGCVVALGEPNENVYKSGRNLPKTEVRLFGDLHAYEVLRRRKLVLTRPAFEELATAPVAAARRARASRG